MFDMIVIGAGISGSVVAERAASQKGMRVLLVDRRNHVGGNCYDFPDMWGTLIHKYGPHIFHTDFKGVVDYLSNFTEWTLYNHEVKAFVDGRHVPVPFNLNSLHACLSASQAEDIEIKLVKRFGFNSRISIADLKNTGDPDLACLHDFVYSKIFLNYTVKQWGLSPDDLDPDVISRVPVFVGKDDRYFYDRYQMMPSRGFTEMFREILNHRNIKLMLNTGHEEVLNIRDGDFYLFGRKFDGVVVFTGSLDDLFRDQVGTLPYRSVDFRFTTCDREYYQPFTIVNYPNQYDFVRITEFKHLYRNTSAGTTILTEYPAEYSKGVNDPLYPVLTENNRKTHAAYVELAGKVKNLVPAGRLAEYRYYDMDDAVARAMEVVEGL